MITAAIVFAVLTTGSTPVSTPPRHAVATECSVTDEECVQQHDANVMTIALLARDPYLCGASTRPAACTEAARMILGIPEPIAADPMLTDPCTYVMETHNGQATLFSPATNRTRRAWIRDHGYVAGQFVGDCRNELRAVR